MIETVHPKNPQLRKIRRIVEGLREGKLIAYPTDTVYAVGCDINNKSAVERMYQFIAEVKQTSHSTLSIICSDLSHISEYADVDNDAYRAMKRCLPGPYTFILRASRAVPKMMLCKRKTIGIRIPDAPIALELVKELGNPLTTTSATLSDGELIPDPWSIENLYGHLVDIVIDGGYLYPEPSTVVDFSGPEPELIRVGKGDPKNL